MARTIIALASILALASACAAPMATAGGPAPLKAQAGTAQPSASGANPEEQKLICETERPVGSNIPRRVCRTPEQIDREREAAQAKIRSMQTPGPKDVN
jgi:hypothetical protein